MTVFIASARAELFPVMCGIYILASLFIIVTHAAHMPRTIAMIFSMALSPHAALGGIVGVMITGIQRAMFSNEAGVGSAAIANAASKTSEPVRGGLVGMLGPFIDTVIVCTMTALVVIITGVWNQPTFAAHQEGLHRVALAPSSSRWPKR